MLERGVQMGLFTQPNNFREMLMVDVGIHSEEPLEDSFSYLNKIFRKRNTNFRRKQRFVVQLVLDPGHKIINIFGGTAFDGFLNRLPICPMVFIFGTGWHDAARIFGAKFRNCAVQHVNLIEKIHSYKGQNDSVKSGENSDSKYLLFTATHSLRSSPSGSCTALRRLPDPNVAAACFMRSYWWVPSGMFFLGLKVLLDRLEDWF